MRLEAGGPTMSDTGTRITIVHRHELFASVIERALATKEFRCCRVVTAGMTTEGVLRAVARSRPDVVLAGMDLRPADGTRILTSLSGSVHRVIVLLDDDRPMRRGEAFATGADTVMATTSPLSALRAHVERSSAEPGTADQAERDVLVRDYRRSQGACHDLMARLSRQEKDLLAHLMTGLCVSDVATLRFVSVATVRTQSKSLLVKLEVSSQLAAVALARSAGHSPGSLYAEQPVAS